MQTLEKIAVFNPRPRIERLRLDNGRLCFVVDDALADADALVQWAVEYRDRFSPVDFSAYPGTFLQMPAPVVARLSDFFSEHLRREFDARRTQLSECRLSLVTLPSHALRPFQSICHADGQHIQATQSIQACVLYLFKNADLGGTSFYEPARPAHEMAALFGDSLRLSAREFTQKYGIAQGYITASNDWFAHVGRVAAQWNRLIVYDGSMLHSGDIFAPEKLSADPLTGRLTLNGFFTSRRRVV